jgi:rod shape-determining protein MreD
VTFFRIFLALMAALVIHMTVLGYFNIFGARPDLLLILTIFFAIFLGGRSGLQAGIAAGFLKDIFAFDVFGVNMLVLGVTGFLVGILNDKFYSQSRGTQVGLVFSFSVFSMSLHYIIASSVLRFVNLGLLDYMISSILPASLYTAAVSFFVFPWLVKLYGLEERRQFL